MIDLEARLCHDATWKYTNRPSATVLHRGRWQTCSRCRDEKARAQEALERHEWHKATGFKSGWNKLDRQGQKALAWGTLLFILSFFGSAAFFQ